jgi:mannosyltransferase OCH1-like enzyme
VFSGAKNKKDFDWTAQPPTVVRPWMVLNEKKTFLAVNHHNADEDDYLVPPIIHQTYKTANLTKLPYLWQISHIKCQAMFPKYKHILWTDESARQFMKTHYPQHLANYDSYKYPIQRVDAARYFILYHYGGIYIDMDIECFNATLDAVRKQYAAVAPATVPFGVRCVWFFVLSLSFFFVRKN